MPSGYLSLIVGAHPTFENGDIKGACNHLTIRRYASHRICFAKNRNNGTLQAINGNGFVPHSHVLKDWHESCCEFRLERLNQNQCKMTRISDNEELIITTGVRHTDLYGNPNCKMDVDGYFSRRLKTFREQNARGKVIFSDDGDDLTVCLYGGRTDMSAAAQDTVWTAVETKTGLLEVDEATYEKERPFGTFTRKKLIVRVDDFTDGESGVLTDHLFDKTNPDEPVIVKKRKSFVDWETKLSLTEQEKVDIQDDKKDLDIRNTEHVRATVVTEKAL